MQHVLGFGLRTLTTDWPSTKREAGAPVCFQDTLRVNPYCSPEFVRATRLARLGESGRLERKPGRGRSDGTHERLRVLPTALARHCEPPACRRLGVDPHARSNTLDGPTLRVSRAYSRRLDAVLGALKFYAHPMRWPD